MKIGVLLADHTSEELQPEFGTYYQMFVEFVRTNVDVDCQLEPFAVVDNEFPANATECDAYIVSGSKFSVYDDETWIKRLLTFIQSSVAVQIPVVGICFGHQAVAAALGGEVRKAGWRVGLQNYHAQDSAQSELGLSSEFKLSASHQDQVQRLPENATITACNATCRIAGFRIADSALTFQGHPEFSNEYCGRLIERRKDLLPSDLYHTGKDSLKGTADIELVGGSIRRFLSGTRTLSD